MIILFILLGLGFLCGGAAAIVDGLPYMVLERGFTQVIIGTVVVVAGVLMLALAWVLVELRRLKRTMSNAAMAMSVASAFASPASERDTALPPPDARAVDTAAGGPAQATAAGIGALAGAGAVLAAPQGMGTLARDLDAPARDEPLHEKPPEASQDTADTRAEPSLLGDEAAKSAAEQAGMRDDEAPLLLEGAGEADVDAIPAFDPFRPIDPLGVPETEARDEASDAGDEPPRFAASRRDTFAIGDTERDAVDAGDAAAEASADEAPALPVAPGLTDIDDPFEPALLAAEAREAETEREADEFGQLRASLTALQREVTAADGRIEPSFSGSDDGAAPSTEAIGHRLDDMAAAENWMDPARQRRAPWFADETGTQREDTRSEEAPHEDAGQAGSVVKATKAETDRFEPVWPEPVWPEPVWPVPALPEPASAPEPDLLAWPPQTREAAAFESEPVVSTQDNAAEPAAIHETEPFALDLAPAAAGAPEPAAPVVAAPPDAPDASDEGIVGAYQVGEAHFTIYADGSIQARTPDGDYSFASMDELKIYLASEKSRLGV